MNAALASRLPSAHGWAGSLALHGAAVAIVLALMQTPAPPEVMRWEVSLLAPPVQRETSPPPRPAPVKALTPPPPERLTTPAQPEPTRAVAAEPAPPQAPVPQPMPIQAPSLAVEPAIRTQQIALPSPPAPPPRVENPVAQPSPPARVDAEAQRRWYTALAAKLAELKRYPMIARRLGQEGVVVLEAQFQGDGHAAARVKRSSGHASLDRAAIQLFEEAMAALSKQLAPPDASSLEIPVAYRLEG